MPGFEDPTVDVGEAGEIERGELVEGPLGLVEAALELAGGRAEGTAARRGSARLRGARIAAQGFAGAGVARRAIGGDEGLGLARAEPVSFDGLGQAPLLGGGERAQGIRDGGGERPGVDARGHLGRESPGEGQAAFGPARAVAEEPGDRRGREAVLVREGAYDPRLVHGPDGLSRRVGGQEERLGRWTRGVLFEDRDVGPAFRTPPGQALEAVDDLEGAVGGRDDAERERSQGNARVGGRAAERRERRAERGDRVIGEQLHARDASTGRSW